MTFREIIETTTPIKVNLLTYGTDGNKVVVHRQTVYPIVDNFYVYSTKPDEYGRYQYYLVARFPCNFAIEFNRLSDYHGDESELSYSASFTSDPERLSLVEYVRKCGDNYRSDETFLCMMDRLANDIRHIPEVGIRMAAEILRDTPDQGAAILGKYRAARQAYREALDERHRAAEEARLAKKQKEEDEQRQKMEESVRILSQSLLTDQSDMRVDVEIIFILAKRLNVVIPINVMGWMRRSLVALTIRNGRLTGYRYRTTKSETIFKYVNQLLDALHREHDAPGND